MPNEALIYRAGSRVDGLDLYVDGYPSHQHKLQSRIGSEPLEDGREVVDHVVATPETVTLTGSVSDMRGGFRTQEAWATLQRIHKASEPIFVYTEWGSYPEMVIAKCEGQTVGRGMSFTLELREILRVSAAVATLEDITIFSTSQNAVGRTGGIARGRVPLGAPVGVTGVAVPIPTGAPPGVTGAVDTGG